MVTGSLRQSKLRRQMLSSSFSVDHLFKTGGIAASKECFQDLSVRFRCCVKASRSSTIFVESSAICLKSSMKSKGFWIAQGTVLNSNMRDDTSFGSRLYAVAIQFSLLSVQSPIMNSSRCAAHKSSSSYAAEVYAIVMMVEHTTS